MSLSCLFFKFQFKERGACDLDYLSCEPKIIPSKLQSLHDGPVTPEITVVSAYFGVERFHKRNEGLKSRYYYLGMLQTFSAIVNPLVFFTDDAQVAEEIRTLRADLPSTKTHIVLMDRSKMWAYQVCPLVNRTKEIRQFSMGMVPHRVGGLYVCSMHAKFEVMDIAARMNFFHTKYIAWQDASIFKHARFDVLKYNYTACLPVDFQDSSIMYGQYGRFKNGSKPGPMVGIWVRGGAFIGESSLMVKHCEDYKFHMMKYLTRGKPINWSLNDQIIIHAMAVDRENPIRVPIIGTKGRPIFICMKRSDGVVF